MLLHSQIIGKGKPFIILHGFLGMGDNWKSIGNQLAEFGYEVHLVDQRNHGRSFHSEKFNYSLMTADLLSYCEHHNLSEVLLLGHSMGGKTAMYFAATHSKYVSKLIVADIAPKAYPLHHQDILSALSLLDFAQIKSRGEVDALLSRSIKEIGVRQFLLKNLYWVHKNELALRINLKVLVRTAEEIGKALPEDFNFRGPTLFLRGEKSGYISEIDELHIKKHFPMADIQTVSRAGHWLHAENPSEFLQNVINFL